ncbi:MAG TPA: prenyltransferase/squalene oxidase repeat-containing protein [Nannocystis sp.]|jgi:squalene-hopene/tetraprenyl-beta-curcumene cyclase
MPALSPIRVPTQGRLRAVIARAAAAAAWWHQQTPAQPDRQPHTDGAAPYLLSIPDIGLACEVLLADRLFHDLGTAERESLAGWVRASQQPSGAWHDPAGRPDLSRTALGWWALVESGDDPAAEHLVRARRIVHELGGAQRASIEVRLWMAMAGHIPWSWLPTMPAELWLLPTVTWLSPSRVSPWARGVMTPYLLLSRAPARVHVSNAATLLLTRPDGEPILPRLVQPGLLGDLLQAFDQGVKLIRKLPRGPVLTAALGRVQRWMIAAQQAHGGWFAAHPTLLSLIALRVLGANYDDPRIVRGLAYMRRARGLVHTPAGPQLAQGLTCAPLTTVARLVRLALASGDPAGEAAVPFFLAEEIRHVGEWQLRTNAPAGGWPCEAGADKYVDTLSTCAVLDALHALPKTSPHQSQVRAAMRRAVEVLFAMQEPDGGFARFERGESEVFMTRFPLRDARLLAAGTPTDLARVRVSATALRQLARLGFQADDDRVARGLQWLWQRVTLDMAGFDLATLGELALCTAALCPPTHPLRQTIERQLRGRQREDGGFGSAVDTAVAMQGLMALEGAACIQTQRAARHLVQLLDNAPPELAQAELSERLGGAWTAGLGLTPMCQDPSAGVREAALALTLFAEHGGQI